MSSDRLPNSGELRRIFGTGAPVVPRGGAECADGAESGLADAILAEIVIGLERLLTGEGGQQIDIRSLPLTETDRTVLRTRLGEGEVKAELAVDGPSQIEETGISGVWWITHRGRDAAILAELIEINFIPDVLCCHDDDVLFGLERVKAMLVGQDRQRENDDGEHPD